MNSKYAESLVGYGVAFRKATTRRAAPAASQRVLVRSDAAGRNIEGGSIR
jgi:hypothetical protein